ncbi:hypothetical protein EDC04DRAFT_691182 [Pisolithus marmoratus]|nr:hypothetical protein EDC04DRAFT_691182 [Pisolithus marmoratus]
MAPVVPGTTELEEATVAILRKACKDGVVKDLTVRMVRQKLEEQFSLEPGTLEANEYKSTIKAAVITNLDEVRASVAACEPPVLVAKGKSNHAASPNKKRKSDRKEEKGTSKRMRKVRMVESSAEESETDAKHERKSRDVPPDLPKAIKSQKKLKNNSKPKVENGSKLESGKFKSKAIIDTSEDEKTEEKPTSPRTSKSKDKKRAQATPTKPTSKPSSNVISNVDLTRNEAPAASSKLASPAKAKAVVDGCDEESELSSLIDEPPKKQRKKQGESDSRTSKRGKKAKELLPKDEATVSKLKAIVVACGVRKVWKKEFQGLDRPKQQINRLHEILAELGMTPRYTMEKARDIKRKREFDQELRRRSRKPNASGNVGNRLALLKVIQTNPAIPTVSPSRKRRLLGPV